MTMNAWRELYQAAMVELDPAQLETRISAASAAIAQRIDELTSQRNNTIETLDELQQLSQATQGLSTLRRLEGLSPSSAPTCRQPQQEAV
jgi:hypothetical protein